MAFPLRSGRRAEGSAGASCARRSKSSDEAAIVEWTRQPCLAGYPLPAAWAEPIRAARSRGPPHRGDVGRLGKAASRRRSTKCSTCGWSAAAPSVSLPTRPCWPSGSAPRCCRRKSWACSAADKGRAWRRSTSRRGTGACSGHGRPPGWPTAACWPSARPSPTAADDPQTVAAHFRVVDRAAGVGPRRRQPPDPRRRGLAGGLRGGVGDRRCWASRRLPAGRWCWGGWQRRSRWKWKGLRVFARPPTEKEAGTLADSAGTAGIPGGLYFLPGLSE